MATTSSFLAILIALIRCHETFSIEAERWTLADGPDIATRTCSEADIVVILSARTPTECAMYCASLTAEECLIASFATSSMVCSGCRSTDLILDQNNNEYVTFVRSEWTVYLVSGPDPIPDEQLTGSSSADHYHATTRGRLDTMRSPPNYVGGWLAALNDPTPYIQADFGRLRYIQGIVTQGRDPVFVIQYVTSYKVSTSTDCSVFGFIVNSDSSDKVFPGNTDSETYVTNMLMTPVFARCVRVHPVTYYIYPTMRFDVLGI